MLVSCGIGRNDKTQDSIRISPYHTIISVPDFIVTTYVYPKGMALNFLCQVHVIVSIMFSSENLCSYISGEVFLYHCGCFFRKLIILSYVVVFSPQIFNFLFLKGINFVAVLSEFWVFLHAFPKHSYSCFLFKLPVDFLFQKKKVTLPVLLELTSTL